MQGIRIVENERANLTHLVTPENRVKNEYIMNDGGDRYIDLVGDEMKSIAVDIMKIPYTIQRMSIEELGYISASCLAEIQDRDMTCTEEGCSNPVDTPDERLCEFHLIQRDVGRVEDQA